MEFRAARLAQIVDLAEPSLALIGETQSMESALPGGWGPRMTVHNGMDGQLVVRVRVPLVVGGGALGTVGADVATPDGGS